MATEPGKLTSLGKLAPNEATPLVGREFERATVSRLLQGLADGTGALVLISGEPGIGKTRLTRELLAPAERQGALAVVGHSYDQLGQRPFEPFAEILGELPRLLDQDASRVVLGEALSLAIQLAPQLQRTYPNEADTPHPVSETRVQLLGQLEQIVERLSDRGPLVLLLEDLHWADESSLALLRLLARRAAARSTLLVATYRDGEVRSGSPLAEVLHDLERERLATELRCTGSTSRRPRPYCASAQAQSRPRL